MGKATQHRHPLQDVRVWTLHTPHQKRPFIRIVCDGCAATAEQHCKVNMPPNVVANNFRREGWKITGEGKKAKCPKCVKARRTREPEPGPKAPTILTPAAARELAKEIDAQVVAKKAADAQRRPGAKLVLPKRNIPDHEPCHCHEVSSSLDAFLRREKLPQKHFADLCGDGVTQNTISRVKLGKMVRWEALKNLATILVTFTGKTLDLSEVTTLTENRSQRREAQRKRLGSRTRRAVIEEELSRPIAPRTRLKQKSGADDLAVCQGDTQVGHTARKRQRIAFSLLEDHYDDTNCKYDEGWSDQKIATETGLSVDYVAQTREEAFGPIVDPAIAEAEAKLVAIEQKLQKFRADIHAEYTQRLVEVDRDIAEVRGELAAIKKGRH